MYVKHGDSKTKLYRVWKTMRGRCNDPTRPHFERYGGRGIKVCQEWQNDYSCFKKWAMEHGYHEGLTIDRIDNNGNYEPENCRWITKKQQAFNRHDTLFFHFNGEVLTTVDLYDRYHIHIQSLIVWRKKGILSKKLKERTGYDVTVTGGKLKWEDE